MSHLPTLGACGDLRPFPSSVTSHLEGNANSNSATSAGGLTRGCLSSDQHLSYLYQGKSLEVVNAKNNERLAAWTFGTAGGAGRADADADFTSSGGGGLEITCVAEIASPSGLKHNQHHQDVDGAAGGINASSASFAAAPCHTGRRSLIVGLSSGLICLFDLKSSKVMRAIRVGKRVTSVSVVSSYGGPMSNHRMLAEELMFFYGVVAVGTSEGRVYLVDLALDALNDIDEDNDVSGYSEGRNDDAMISTESHPAALHFISVSDPGSNDNIAHLRQSLMRSSTHLCLRLNDLSYANNKTFQHVSSATGDSVYFPEKGVHVCSLKLVPQLASLAVGFNFGSFQLWNLSRLEMEYSSTYTGSDSLPLTGFTFQEPDNDPRNFCYLWAMQSENDFDLQVEKMRVTSFGAVTLYALGYDHRDEADQYGVLYSGLTSCQPRFAHTLLGDPLIEREIIGSIGLSSSTLGSCSPSSRVLSGGVGPILVDITDPENFASNLGLAVFLWEVHFAEEDQSDYYYGLFDLNAWYQAQMPSCVTLAPDNSQCSYFGFCSLDDVVMAAREAQFGSRSRKKGSDEMATANMINIGIDLSSLSRYQSLSSAEQHFFPSSLAFDITCLLDQGVVHCTNLGFQRKVLLDLLNDGRSALVEPQNLHQLCVASGLIAKDDVVGSYQGTSMLSSVTDMREQRMQLLTVALENHLVILLTGCIVHWKDGKYSQADCTLKFVLDWSWDRVTHTKQMLDKVTLPLFDHSRLELNETTRKLLIQSSQQLRHLCTVLEQLVRHSGAFVTEQGLSELQTKRQVASLVNQYLKVILWFFDAGLLPEVPEDSECEESQFSNSPYPATPLVTMYKTKREKMRQLLEKFDDLKIPCLIIDGLCSELGEVLQHNFERDGGDGLYPPPTFHALLTTYLINGDRRQDGHQQQHQQHQAVVRSNEVLKHRIVQYLFLDIASYLSGGDKWSGLVENLIKFPSAFSVTPSLIKLTQAFWLLDHEDFDEALTMLLDPIISNNDIELWQHRAVLVAFLVQDQAKLALKYARIRQPPQKDLVDIQMHIAILMSNGMVHEAFQYQRQRRNTSNSSAMMQYFFDRAEKLGKLDSVLQLSLMMVEEKELINFLRRSKRPSSQEILLMYYLQRSRYGEAMALNEQLDARKGSKERSSTRRAIMERYSKANLIPNAQMMKRFGDGVSMADRLKLKTSNFPVPLSVEVRNKEFNPVFHSSTIRDEMDRRKNELEEHMGQDRTAAPFTPFRSRVQQQRRTMIDREAAAGMDVFSVKKRRFAEVPNVVFPEDVSFNESIQERGRSGSPPFSKRPHLDEAASGRNGSSYRESTSNWELPDLSPAGKERIARLKSTKDGILSILQTPKVVKKRAGRPSLGGLDSARRASAIIATPQSILKVKRLMSEHTPPASGEVKGVNVAQKLNLSGEEDEHWLVSTSTRSRESTPGKSLRFHVPKSLPSEEMIGERLTTKRRSSVEFADHSKDEKEEETKAKSYDDGLPSDEVIGESLQAKRRSSVELADQSKEVKTEAKHNDGEVPFEEGIGESLDMRRRSLVADADLQQEETESKSSEDSFLSDAVIEEKGGEPESYGSDDGLMPDEVIGERLKTKRRSSVQFADLSKEEQEEDTGAQGSDDELPAEEVIEERLLTKRSLVDFPDQSKEEETEAMGSEDLSPSQEAIVERLKPMEMSLMEFDDQSHEETKAKHSDDELPSDEVIGERIKMKGKPSIELDDDCKKENEDETEESDDELPSADEVIRERIKAKGGSSMELDDQSRKENEDDTEGKGSDDELLSYKVIGERLNTKEMSSIELADQSKKEETEAEGSDDELPSDELIGERLKAKERLSREFADQCKEGESEAMMDREDVSTSEDVIGEELKTKERSLIEIADQSKERKVEETKAKSNDGGRLSEERIETKNCKLSVEFPDQIEEGKEAEGIENNASEFSGIIKPSNNVASSSPVRRSLRTSRSKVFFDEIPDENIPLPSNSGSKSKSVEEVANSPVATRMSRSSVLYNVQEQGEDKDLSLRRKMSESAVVTPEKISKNRRKSSRAMSESGAASSTASNVTDGNSGRRSLRTSRSKVVDEKTDEKEETKSPAKSPSKSEDVSASPAAARRSSKWVSSSSILENVQEQGEDKGTVDLSERRKMSESALVTPEKILKNRMKLLSTMSESSAASSTTSNVTDGTSGRRSLRTSRSKVADKNSDEKETTKKPFTHKSPAKSPANSKSAEDVSASPVAARRSSKRLSRSSMLENVHKQAEIEEYTAAPAPSPRKKRSASVTIPVTAEETPQNRRKTSRSSATSESGAAPLNASRNATAGIPGRRLSRTSRSKVKDEKHNENKEKKKASPRKSLSMSETNDVSYTPAAARGSKKQVSMSSVLDKQGEVDETPKNTRKTPRKRATSESSAAPSTASKNVTFSTTGRRTSRTSRSKVMVEKREEEEETKHLSPHKIWSKPESVEDVSGIPAAARISSKRVSRSSVLENVQEQEEADDTAAPAPSPRKKRSASLDIPVAAEETPKNRRKTSRSSAVSESGAAPSTLRKSKLVSRTAALDDILESQEAKDFEGAAVASPEAPPVKARSSRSSRTTDAAAATSASSATATRKTRSESATSKRVTRSKPTLEKDDGWQPFSPIVEVMTDAQKAVIARHAERMAEKEKKAKEKARAAKEAAKTRKRRI